jgi:hypothetical protein
MLSCVEPSANERSVVIVEDRADLATTFADLGYEVELLTARGWAGERDGRSRDASFAVCRYGPWAARFARLGARTARFARLSQRWRVTAMVGAARAHRRAGRWGGRRRSNP